MYNLACSTIPKQHYLLSFPPTNFHTWKLSEDFFLIHHRIPVHLSPLFLCLVWDMLAFCSLCNPGVTLNSNPHASASKC
jgi:hypothetical protein